MSEILTVADAAELADHEAAIERGLKTFIDVGLRLVAVRDKRLYRADYATFEDYCEGRWNFSDRRARQLIDAAGIVNALPTGTIVPVTESQARELTGLAPDEAAEVMNRAHDNTAGKVTAAAIRDARNEAPGGLKEQSPGQTDRVAEALNRARNGGIANAIPEPDPVAPKQQKAPPKATFANLMRKLTELNRIADECIDIADELEFDADAAWQGLVYEGSDQYDSASALAENLSATVEDIVNAIEGR